MPLTMTAESTDGATSETIGDGKRATPEPVRAEFAEFGANLDAAAIWRAAVDSFGGYLEEGPGLAPWEEIASRIGRCLAEGRAASFLRIGDAEGNLLALGLGEYPALTDHCARAVSRMYFGRADALLRGGPELLPLVHEALRNAELIGFPGPFGGPMLLQRPDAETYIRPIHGLASVHRYLTRFAAELRLGSKTGAPAGFHRGLLPHYPALVSGRSVGMVTCHPQLAQGLRTRMGATEVDLREVPRQAILTSDPGADTGHWPGRFRELRAELRTVEPGTLWFVAAGTFGKVYCDVIRSAGAIAVDIGHTADVWAGVRTRVAIKPEALATWSIV
jgi:hypothetical protein